MSISSTCPDVLALLYDQQRNYNAQLDQNHESLSKLYGKLARVERVLATEREFQMKRSCRKKWKWTQLLTKRSITALQDRQEVLYQHLDQCASLIGSYYEQTIAPSPTPWMHLPPSPCMLTPSTPFPFSPWAANFSRGSSSDDSETTYWDLSRLREPSPFSSMVDSGYYEPQSEVVENDQPSFDWLDESFSLEIPSPMGNDSGQLCLPLVVTSDAEAPIEEGDSRAVTSATTLGAQSHRRCVSAEVGSMMNGGLHVLPSSKRGTSVGPAVQARDGNNGLVG